MTDKAYPHIFIRSSIAASTPHCPRIANAPVVIENRLIKWLVHTAIEDD
jgi:hypothetical protein